jgi:hypothetical protein
MLPVSELTIYAASARHHTEHADALAEGLKAHGVAVKLAATSYRARSKLVACWGWRIGRGLRAQGHEVLVMERGYMGDRFAWTSLGWNGLNGRARFAPRDDPARFAAHFPAPQPWKAGGDYVLLIGQVPGDASLGGMDLTFWYERTAKQAALVYGKPVRFRPHPLARARQKVKLAATLGGTLAEALEHAQVCVTFNSNAGVDAVLAGVPTIACDIGSMAYPVTARRLGETYVPDREPWAARLAWCQWSLEEIRSGAAWEAIRPQQQALALESSDALG